MVFLLPTLAGVGLVLGGGWVWLQPMVMYGLIPLIELGINGTTDNLPYERDSHRRNHWIARLILMLLFPFQLLLVLGLIWQAETFTYWELPGVLIGVGSSLGAMGITGAHELGHSRERFDKLLAEGLLFLSLFLHFLIEHNRAHHAWIGTPEDPATAPKGQTVYAFWWQTLVGGAKSAWILERNRLARSNSGPWTMHNALLRYGLLQAVGVLAVGFLAGPWALGLWVMSSIVGILLLETTNYLQHYGLSRKPLPGGGHERVGAKHSWTCNRPLSRAVLINLPRHADHHMAAGRHFTNLRHLSESPELPFGYPAMVMISLVPPLFKRVMDPRLAKLQALEAGSGVAAEQMPSVG